MQRCGIYCKTMEWHTLQQFFSRKGVQPSQEVTNINIWPISYPPFGHTNSQKFGNMNKNKNSQFAPWRVVRPCCPLPTAESTLDVFECNKQDHIHCRTCLFVRIPNFTHHWLPQATLGNKKIKDICPVCRRGLNSDGQQVIGVGQITSNDVDYSTFLRWLLRPKSNNVEFNERCEFAKLWLSEGQNRQGLLRMERDLNNEGVAE